MEELTGINRVRVRGALGGLSKGTVDDVIVLISLIAAGDASLCFSCLGGNADGDNGRAEDALNLLPFFNGVDADAEGREGTE
jgi:hypothetical protein